MNKLFFEPTYLFSNADDSIIDVVKEGLNSGNLNRLSNSVENSTEEYSNFQLFGIGKPSKKQIERREKRKAKKEEFKGMTLTQKSLVIQQRYNPAAAIPRAGVLAGVRVNIFGVAVRLYPAFLTPEEARKKKIRIDAIEPAKKAWEKVRRFWIGLGGSPLALQKEIMKGYDKPVFKWTKSAKKRIESQKSFDAGNGFDLEDDLYYGAYDGGASAIIAAGIGLIGTIIGMINKSGAKKNPYEEGVNPNLESDISQTGDVPVADPNEIKKIEEAAEADRKKGLPDDEGVEDDKILGIPKTGFWIGVGVLGLAAIGLTVYLIKKK